MVITWLGQACFKIQSGDLVVVIDPFSKDIGLTPPRFRADIVLKTHEHYDHSNAESLTGEPFLISGPGEYEIKGVYVRGLQTFHDKSQGRERGTNTIYVLGIEGLRLLHLGDFGEGELRSETLEELDDIDVVFIPVGGKYTIDHREATKVVQQLEPRLVVPMHYKIPGLKIGLENAEPFLKEMGAKKSEPQEKLVLKKKDLEGNEKTEVVVLKPS